jgi:hypothetical protein
MKDGIRGDEFCTILAWRRSLAPSFQLFPVCLMGVDDALLAKHQFGPLMLGLIQKIESEDPKKIADAIRAQIAQPDIGSPTLFDRIVGRLKDLLLHILFFRNSRFPVAACERAHAYADCSSR